MADGRDKNEPGTLWWGKVWTLAASLFHISCLSSGPERALGCKASRLEGLYPKLSPRLLGKSLPLLWPSRHPGWTSSPWLVRKLGRWSVLEVVNTYCPKGPGYTGRSPCSVFCFQLEQMKPAKKTDSSSHFPALCSNSRLRVRKTSGLLQLWLFHETLRMRKGIFAAEWFCFLRPVMQSIIRKYKDR